MSPGVVGKKQISSQKSQLPQSEGAGEREKRKLLVKSDVAGTRGEWGVGWGRWDAGAV